MSDADTPAIPAELVLELPNEMADLSEDEVRQAMQVVAERAYRVRQRIKMNRAYVPPATFPCKPAASE